MWIDIPDPMKPPFPHVPVPPREIFWVIFKVGFFHWIPDNLGAALLIAAVPALLFVVLTFFATRKTEHDQQLQGG